MLETAADKKVSKTSRMNVKYLSSFTSFSLPLALLTLRLQAKRSFMMNSKPPLITNCLAQDALRLASSSADPMTELFFL